MKLPSSFFSLLMWGLCQLLAPLNALSQEQDLEGLLKEAKVLFSRADYSASKERFNRVLRIAPNHPDACVYMGFIEDVQLNSSPVETARWWVRGLRSGGKGPDKLPTGIKPEQSLKRVAGRLSEDGKVAFQSKRYDRAREYFELARDLDPQLPEIESRIKRVNDITAEI
ncbi:tetratricopeptide repeat protein, partial [candidate division KSB1 bacterium]|nr:tetratricopeptide repeat protein [candidate division KSB1 bacterium]